MPGMKGPILIMIALVALMALTCAAAQPSFPYCTCSEKGWASSPFALVSTGPARVRPGSVELGFQLEAKQGWTSNGSPCAQALATLGVAKLHIASSLACIGRGPVEVFINDVLCTECRVEEAPNVPGFAQLRVKFRTPVTQSAAIRIVGFGPCSTPTALLDSSGDSQAVVVRYAVFSTQQLKPRVCCPRSSLRVPLIGVYEPPIRSSLPPPRPSPRVHSPPPPRSPSPSPPPPPSPSPSHLPPPPVGGSPASPSPSPPRPRPPPPPPGSGLVSCTGASTNGGVCAASALPTNLGVCINRACCGSQGAALLQKQIIGQVEKLVFGSNDTAEFSVAGGLTGLLRLGPAGPAQVKLTLDGVVYTATFGNTDALLAVSGSNGVQLTIYPPSSGRVRVVFFSQTFGSSDFQVPFDIPSGTNGRRRLQQGGGGGSNVGDNNPCVPPAARSFCAGFGLTSAPAAMALSDALRDLAANIALELQQSLELSSDSLGMVCGEVLAGVATVTTSCSAISALKAFKKVSTCANPPPLPPQAACDSPVSQSGNQGTFSYTVLVGAGTRVNLQYDAQSIPDIYRVFDAATGTKLFQVAAGASGYCIEPDAPGAGSVNIIKPFASTSLIVAVEAPCDSTVWSFTLNCATR